MKTPEWISRSVSRRQTASDAQAVEASGRMRSTHDRLKATLRRSDEALSPRMLRRSLQELQAIIDPHVSEVEGGRRAKALADWYQVAAPERRRDLWLLISEQFVADPVKVKTAQQQFATAVGTPEEAVAEVNFRRATVSPRRRLLQRFSVYPGGIQFLVDMRAEMQTSLRQDKRLMALDVEMEYMFSTWFDVGFLDLRRISWDSPASLIEKLIQYEAVHDIKSWADVKNRLDSDRRCYGFFHPRLPEVPLIFVEVALVDEMASNITPLLDELAADADLNRATTAIFYSISNTQTGLRGVSFGDSLIKRVVESLKDEFPKLKTFATLSPIPGFRAWLGKNANAMVDALDAKERKMLSLALVRDSAAAPRSESTSAQTSEKASGKTSEKAIAPVTAQTLLAVVDASSELPEKSALRHWVLRCAAHYLGQALVDGKPLDPVARFHLGNGARVERLNWAGDPSIKGQKQSYGLMVNYLYDLKRLDKHRAQLAQGSIPVSGAVQSLFIGK